MKEIRQKAKELMRGACRLCPVCDGRACAGEVPGMGGLGSAAAFKDNVKALAETALNMRLIHEADAPDTSCTGLGLHLAMPVVAAPIGGMFNFNDAVTEEDYVTAVVPRLQRGRRHRLYRRRRPPGHYPVRLCRHQRGQWPRHSLHQTLGKRGTRRKT